MEFLSNLNREIEDDLNIKWLRDSHDGFDEGRFGIKPEFSSTNKLFSLNHIKSCLKQNIV